MDLFRPKLRESLSAFDTDGDGFIDPDELALASVMYEGETPHVAESPVRSMNPSSLQVVYLEAAAMKQCSGHKVVSR